VVGLITDNDDKAYMEEVRDLTMWCKDNNQVCNVSQTLPHSTRVGAGVVRFDLSPVLKLHLFDGSSEGIAGFLISFEVRVPLLESDSSTL
jgi:hypothetical protein